MVLAGVQNRQDSQINILMSTFIVIKMNLTRYAMVLVMLTTLLMLTPKSSLALGLGSIDLTIPHVQLGVISGATQGDLSSAGFTMHGNINMSEYNITNTGYLGFSNTGYTALIYLDAQGNIHIGGD